MGTYSFLDVHAALVGPGVAIALGDGSGSAEEGISFSPVEDMNQMTTGADGETMHSLRASRAGQARVRLLKTSPVNALLMAAAMVQRTSAALHGKNVLTLVNRATGDAITNSRVAFKRVPDLNYAKDGGIVEWLFDIGRMDPVLGALA